MDKLIEYPLIVMFLMFVISLVFGLNPTSVTASAPGGYVYQIQLGGMVASLAAIPLALALVGIRVLGSGLSDTSVTIINRTVIYALVWTILSSTSLPFLLLIPMFGALIYLALMLSYAFGIFLSIAKIGGGGASTGKEGAGGDGGEGA